MQGVEDILVPAITALMLGQERRAVQDLNVKGIGFHGHFPHGAVDWNRVAIGLKHDLAIGRDSCLHKGTIVEGEGRKWPQERPFCFPHLANGL